MTATVPFLDPDGNALQVPTADVEELRATLGSDSYMPGDADYDTVRAIWNAMIDRRPALICQCQGSSDVQRCVLFAKRHGLALAVRGGGHNVGGRALVEGGLLVDLSTLKDVDVDLEADLARVQPGVTLGDLDRATAPHGVVVPTGVVSQTGVAGLTLGGGFGWLSKRWGLTCDHLVAAEVVTADGEILTVDEANEPELFWALCGGGGGFAIVTEFVFRLRHLDPEVTAGLLVHPPDELAAAIDHYRAVSMAAPDTLGLLLKLCAAPPAPFVPKEIHGQPVAISIACHSGAGSEIEADLAPLRAGTPAVADVIEPRQFADFQAMFDAGEPDGRRNYWKSEYVSELDDEMLAVLAAKTRELPSASANIKVFALGGEVARGAAGKTAVGHRDARYIVILATSWDDPADDAVNVAWAREGWQAIHARSQRGGYVNFLTEDMTPEDAEQSLGGVDLGRLTAVKQRWDPADLFGRLI